MRRFVATELFAMVAVIAMAGVSVFATLGSARSGDLVFCRLVDGDVVIGATTDCSTAVSVERIDSDGPLAGVECGIRLVADTVNPTPSPNPDPLANIDCPPSSDDETQSKNAGGRTPGCGVGEPVRAGQDSCSARTRVS